MTREVDFQIAVSQEFRAALLEQFLIGRHHRALFRPLPTGARTVALDLHLMVETFAVNGETALASHIFLLVEREPVGVVQLERYCAGDGVAGDLLNRLAEFLLGRRGR